jgi:hypothetical protein
MVQMPRSRLLVVVNYIQFFICSVGSTLQDNAVGTEQGDDDLHGRYGSIKQVQKNWRSKHLCNDMDCFSVSIILVCPTVS